MTAKAKRQEFKVAILRCRLYTDTYRTLWQEKAEALIPRRKRRERIYICTVVAGFFSAGELALCVPPPLAKRNTC